MVWRGWATQVENIAVREIIEQFGKLYRIVVKNFHSRRRREEMLGVSGRGRIVEQPAFRNEIRIERHVFVVFHLVRAAASTTNQLKYRLYTLVLHGNYWALGKFSKLM